MVPFPALCETQERKHMSDIGDQIEGHHTCHNCKELRERLLEAERERMLFKRNALHAQQELEELRAQIDELEAKANFRDEYE